MNIQKNDRDKVVAIDGPAGSGKSSVAKLLAERLNAVYIDTGAMFRALAYYFDKKKVKFEEGPELLSELEKINFEYGVSSDCLVRLDGEDLTVRIRQHYVSELASKLSKLSMVRSYLLERQREIGKREFSIMEGRDIGTVVFPRAFLKIFLTAGVEERAKRRLKQLAEQGKAGHNLAEILSDLKIRDERDSNRKEAPLKAADDSLIIDSSNLNLDQVIDKISLIVEERR